jgi:hypothetical protein
MSDRDLTSSQRRLAEELEEDGVTVSDEPVARRLIIEELDHARRIPAFEGRRPVYGAMVTSSPERLRGIDLVDVRHGLEDARTYADGRSAYLVRRPDHPSVLALACFDRNMQFEADLVALQEATGASIVQRTPVFAVTRLFRTGQVVSWNGRSWSVRPTASSLLPTLLDAAPEVDENVARGVLDLAIHWLSPTRSGATLIIQDSDDDGSFDLSTATTPPPLNVTDRRHRPPLLSTLMQRDLAAAFDASGNMYSVGVGLRFSVEAEAQTGSTGGMRHRSAERWSFDHPGAVVVVVSEDGPVTVYRAGRALLAHCGDPSGQ